MHTEMKWKCKSDISVEDEFKLMTSLISADTIKKENQTEFINRITDSTKDTRNMHNYTFERILQMQK